MADQEDNNILLLKDKNISVFVNEALPDILVVTYEHGPKAFKGVLLDSNKKNLPCGIEGMNPAFKITPKPKAEEDVLYSVNQRFAYTDPNAPKRKNIRIASKYKSNKMTVRLRPRQVLCSKCKGICSENSENVSRKRKSLESVHIVPAAKRASNAPVTRSAHSELNNEQAKLLGPGSLVPRLTRLTPQEESLVMERLRQKKPLIASNSNEQNTNTDQDFETKDTNKNSEPYLDGKSVKRVPRKKRSVGSMEDLWDETVFEENSNVVDLTKDDEEPTSVSTINTRTIKISYGPQGEGTVLKIPAQIESTSENVDVVEVENDESDIKATRRALKRAKKEAKRKVFLTGGSPCYLTSNSPRYTIGGASPRHCLGNNSPRYVYDVGMPRRRKHKVKHKKKHKEDRDKKHNNREGEVSSTQDEVVTQKLSINLKKLNNTYTSCPPPLPPPRQANEVCNKNEENGSSSDEHCEQVPNFPQSNPPLMLRIHSQTVSSAISASGSRIFIGDVVWGKVQGFPWWPAKILTITNNCGGQGPQAHVSWYGSSTSSLMQCDQLSPYLENFKIRYNKKKKGMYKEAIKQATFEAKENADIVHPPPPQKSSPQHSVSFVPQVVPPALASPREIDVVS